MIRCKYCRFYQVEEDSRPNEAEGSCRKYAPRVVLEQTLTEENRVLGVFPPVKADDWCGEAEAKPYKPTGSDDPWPFEGMR